MAVDEVLLDSAAENGIATLRFYRWSEPTLSLGYFQSAADRNQHPPSATCAMVRRTSGGGAILHDRELTYSLALPAGHPLSKDADELYCAVHSALIGLLNDNFRPTSKWKGQKCVAHDELAEEPFLCFQRRSSGDVLLASEVEPTSAQKVGGSAQRRRRGAVLQHGSLLLSESPFAPELPGIEQITGVRLDEQELIGAWVERLKPSLIWRVSRIALTEKESAQICERKAERFASPAWTNRR